MMAKQRQEVLGAVAVEAGRAWFDWWRAELERQGRPMTGGWPGTISEARRRILAGSMYVLGAEGALRDHELVDLARTAFETARAAWMASAVRELE